METNKTGGIGLVSNNQLQLFRLFIKYKFSKPGGMQHTQLQASSVQKLSQQSVGRKRGKPSAFICLTFLRHQAVSLGELNALR